MVVELQVQPIYVPQYGTGYIRQFTPERGRERHNEITRLDGRTRTNERTNERASNRTATDRDRSIDRRDMNREGEIERMREGTERRRKDSALLEAAPTGNPANRTALFMTR